MGGANTATGASPQPVANSQFGGIAGSASNMLGRAGDTMQNLMSGNLGTGAQPRPDYNAEQEKMNNQYMKNMLGNAMNKVGSSPYDRAAKSSSDSAAAWSAMQRGSNGGGNDDSGSLNFASMGGYIVPESGEEKVSQGWADAFKSVGTAAMNAYGQKYGQKGANSMGSGRGSYQDFNLSGIGM